MPIQHEGSAFEGSSVESAKVPDFKGLRGKFRNYLTPPNYLAMISGAVQAMQDRKGLVTLTYQDGTTETRPCSHDIAAFDSWLDLVSFVQAGRSK